jgi:V-type H+-transporting ATPase subunit a
MINMFLHPGDQQKGVGLLFDGQLSIATVFVLVAFICVPIMLLVKPIHFKITHKEEHTNEHSATAL